MTDNEITGLFGLVILFIFAFAIGYFVGARSMYKHMTKYLKSKGFKFRD